MHGTPNAVARVPSRLVRLRLVNGSNARIFDLSFGDRRAFHWIGSEGGLLEKPLELQSLMLAPGCRSPSQPDTGLLARTSAGRAAAEKASRVQESIDPLVRLLPERSWQNRLWVNPARRPFHEMSCCASGGPNSWAAAPRGRRVFLGLRPVMGCAIPCVNRRTASKDAMQSPRSLDSIPTIEPSVSARIHSDARLIRQFSKFEGNNTE
jgi:hypothetical protein